MTTGPHYSVAFEDVRLPRPEVAGGGGRGTWSVTVARYGLLGARNRFRVTPGAAAELLAAFLALPLMIFLIGYLHSAISLVIIASIVGLLLLRRRWVHGLSWGGQAVILSRRAVFAFAATATALSGYTGILGGVRSTTDWYKHFSILGDLTTLDWPVSYPDVGNPTLIYSFALYLPAALAGKLAGGSIVVAHVALFLWMALGFFLLLLAIAVLLPRRFRAPASVAALVSYAGADALGTWITSNRDLSSVNGFWVGFASYTASFTAIRWVPQHALASYAIGALYVLAWREGTWVSIRRVSVVAMLSVLWTPFAVLGAIPLIGALVIRQLMRQRRVDLGEVGIAAAVLVSVLPALAFVLVPRSGQRVGATQLDPGHIALFLALMIVPWLLVSAVASNARGVLIGPSALLVVLPLFVLGQNNDLVMRSSLAALFVICLVAWRTVLLRLQARRHRAGMRTRVSIALLTVAVLLGFPTAAAEFNLAVTTHEDGGAMVAGSPWDQNLANYLVSSGSGPGSAIWAQYMTCAYGRPVQVLGLPECRFDPQTLIPPADVNPSQDLSAQLRNAKTSRFWPSMARARKQLASGVAAQTATSTYSGPAFGAG